MYLCICACIDPRLGWEPCSVPAWLINGVVMTIGRNEGMKRRRPASLDPYALPGTYTVSHTDTNSLSMHYTFLTDTLVTQTTMSSCLFMYSCSLTHLSSSHHFCVFLSLCALLIRVLFGSHPIKFLHLSLFYTGHFMYFMPHHHPLFYLSPFLCFLVLFTLKILYYFL